MFSPAQSQDIPQEPLTIEAELKECGLGDEIKLCSTCCDNSIFEDHELTIMLNNDTKIFSYASMMSKELTIDPNDGYIYKRTFVDAGSFLSSIFSLFGNRSKTALSGQVDLGPTEKAYVYKKLAKENGLPNETSAQKITEEEFNLVLALLPEGLKEVIDTRENRGQYLAIVSAARPDPAQAQVGPEPTQAPSFK